ncbi:MAG: extracellular solute-binding protein family 1 [Dehalococcoidia bacterium]|nr:extracellular solute-binding protein family 1 [Dehalococcoidia bacterium]
MGKSWTLALVVFMVFIFSCSSVTTPSFTEAPKPTATVTPSSDVATAPSVAPDDAVWAQVVKAARQEGTVVGYVATGLCCEWGQAMAKAFKEKYGITVELLSLSGRQAVEKVSVEQQIGKPIADFVQTGVATAMEAHSRGMSVSIVRDLPVMRDKNVFITDPVFSPGEDILNLAPNVITILVNDKVKPEDYPRSYKDLLNPKWKGQIIMSDPRSGGGTVNMFTTHSYYKTLDLDFWRDLMKQKPALWAGSSTEEYNMVARGEYLIDFNGGGGSTAAIIAEGAPMRGDLAMVEGTVNQSYTMQVVKNAAHPNAVRVLVNWIFSQEGQDIYARVSARASQRKDVPDYTTPRARVKSIRLLDRTWDAAVYGDKLANSGILEEIFGKK